MAGNSHALHSSLESFRLAHCGQDRLMYDYILQDVKTLLEPILTELHKRDPLLNFSPLDSTTLHQGKARHIYEGFLCLKDFRSDEDELSIEDGNSPTGFAFAKLSHKKSPYDELCIESNSGKKFLSSRIISEKLLSHVRVLLSNGLAKEMSACDIELIEHLEGNAVSIKCRSNTSPPRYRPFKLHLIPTIPCAGRWTLGANAWLAEESHWPSKSMKHNALLKGIHLVGRSAPTKSPCQWQVAFLEPMKMLLEDSNICREKCLEIMKLILNRSPILQKGLTMFLLETVILDLYKKYPQVNFWREDKFTQRFIDFVEELEQAVQAANFHDFFLFDLNLLKDLDQHTAEVCKEQLKKLVEDPVGFFSDLKTHGVEQDTHL